MLCDETGFRKADKTKYAQRPIRMCTWLYTICCQFVCIIITRKTVSQTNKEEKRDGQRYSMSRKIGYCVGTVIWERC